MILFFKKNKIVLLGLLLVIGFFLILNFNPTVQSRLTFYRKNQLADAIIEKQKENLERIFAEQWPELKRKAELDFKNWPTELSWMKQYFSKPILFEVAMDKNKKGYLLLEGGRKAKSCPPFPGVIGRGYHLSLKKEQSSLAHYEFSNRNQKVLIETRRRAFHCEIEILIKDQNSRF